MVVRLKLFVKDGDTVPELWVLDILKTIEGSLIRVEGILEVLNKKVAMAEGCPSWTIFRVNGDELDIVLNCSLILTISRTILGKFVDSIKVHQVVAITSFSSIRSCGWSSISSWWRLWSWCLLLSWLLWLLWLFWLLIFLRLTQLV